MKTTLTLPQQVLRIRRIEEAISNSYPQQKMRCPVHLSIGQEAVAVGVCAHLRESDYAVSGHRAHAHYLAKGGDLKKMISEIYGKQTGCCAGRGGSMHLVDLSIGFLGSTPIVGGSIPIGVGAAFGAQMRGEDRIVAIFLGEGSTEEGIFVESLNFAALKKLPVLFICENNLYSVYSPLAVRQPKERSIPFLAEAHGIFALQGEGNCLETVCNLSQKAIEHIRNGRGPALIEFATYRFREHCGPDFDPYQPQEELAHWKLKDPISNIEESEEYISQEIKEAFDFAEKSPFPVYAGNEETDANKQCTSYYTGMTCEENSKTQVIKYNEAILQATDQLMKMDPSIYIMGLGVPDPKGIFGTTLGLVEKYGTERVLDMPTSENGMTGIAIGSAIVGMRPIMTHQRVDFFLLALDQLINNAAKWHDMFGGQMSVPLVIRLIIGRGWGQGPQHSQTLHSLFAHIPGLKVVMPSTPYDAKGLLVAAVKDPNPVIYIEHRWLHNIHGEVPQEIYSVPIGKAKIVREGTDISIIACSHMVLEAYKAAIWLQEEGISVELLDLRSIKPLDKEALLATARKTGMVLVADPDWKTAGFAAEILALITEEGFHCLKAAPQRVTYPDTLTPTSWALANHFYPTAKDIALTVLKMLKRPVQARKLMEAIIQEKIASPLDVPDSSFLGPF